ncbi:MAG: DoxX family protein [Formosimonas sp.]
MNISKNPLDLIGRLLIAVLFVPAALSKITGFEGTVGYIASAGLPMPTVAAIVAIAVELLAPLAIVFGFKTRCAALVLAAFTVAAGFGFHAFWYMPADQVMVNQIMFFKNLAIAGGLLILAAHSGACPKKA